MKNTARHTAYQALLQMEENEGYSNIVIDKALRAAELDSRDAGLASAIFYGVLERRLPLEHFLRGCLKDPKGKVDAALWTLLQCAAYQILYLDRVPDSAAVNEAVEESKTIKGGVYAGLVNGVLRSLVRKKERLSLPDGDGLFEASLRYSIPQELISLWRRSYGKELARRLLDSFQRRPPLYIRVNPLRADVGGAGGFPEALRLFHEASCVSPGGRCGGGKRFSCRGGGISRGAVPCAGPFRAVGLLAAGGTAGSNGLRLLRRAGGEELHSGGEYGKHRHALCL